MKCEFEVCFIPLQNYLRSGVPTGGLDVASFDINTIQEGGGVWANFLTFGARGRTNKDFA